MALKPNDALSSAREISDQYRTPFDTTAKIMQTLNRAKVLSSNQGVNGGYKLAKDLKNLNYIQLSEIIEKKNFEMSCEGPNGLCDLYDVCNIKSPITAVNHKLREFFNKLSIYELLLIDEQKKKQGKASPFEAVSANMESSNEL
jgi:Rrf2 family protein